MRRIPSRRSASARIGSSPAPSASAIAASYAVMASVVRAERSSTRAWSTNRCAAPDGDVPAGAGKYLATYELDSLAVLSSPEYLARYLDPTPWSRRCLGKAVVFKRWACEQVEPGNADPHPEARALLLNAVAPGALQIRRFVAQTGDAITLCEVSTPPTSGLAYRRYQP